MTHQSNTNLSLRAGVAVRGIEPDPALVDRSLHGNMSVRFDERGSPLEAKCLALEWGEARHLLVALDLVGVHRAHSARIAQRIAAATGIDEGAIVICASHSHSTPFLEPLSGPRPYFEFVAQQVVEAARDAVE